jgi:hypothetical protein
MGNVWKGEKVAKNITKYGYDIPKGDQIFEIECVDCGAKQTFQLRDNVLTLIISEHKC